ncbi:class I SAM-dependent methyltransferase [Arenimonas sp. MALMAid1274]|uniref:class I SAM-dependent methyltransferase n=1 Tax=Arenimonas sp. MALMAid1274 TaxID=3411630 RepID=UPI003B9F3148
MPPAPARRQPDLPADAWFRREATLRLVQEVQRQAVPELTRVFGHTGLYLRPCAALAPTLSGNLLASVLSLHREQDGLAGELRCRDDRLPLASASLSLVYGLFVFESSPDPRALLAEVARVLKPDGVALLVTLNPYSPARFRWAFRGLHSVDPAAFEAQVRDSGLDVQRRRYLGPRWSLAKAVDIDPRRGGGRGSRLRMASLVVARRRDAALTPLRATAPALKFRPGMSAG